ncbi:flippase [Hydrogenophaga sp.]|uniref:flippase n=1 Tax=Hydrogenophaga sp. TaxID=1904254 RepID=UPI00286D7DB8|nr:flippase [Hydrogenophaga sp.]
MSIGRHTLLNLGSALIPMAIALTTVPLYLGYIGAERFGVLAVIWALLGYFGLFDLGFGRAVTQRMARLPEADEIERSKLLWTAFLSTFLLGMLASMLVWLFADYILLNVIDMSAQSRREVAIAVTWMLIALPALLTTTVLTGAMQARLRFTELNAIQLLGNSISHILPLAVAASGRVELNFLVPAMLVSRVLLPFLLFRQCRQHVPLIGIPVIDRTHFKAMLNYGGWVSVMMFIAPLLVIVDRLIIATISGAKAVTSYTVPYDLVSRTMIISGSLSSALFPRLASAGAVEAHKLAERATIVLIAIMTPVVITGIFLAQPALNLWLGYSLAANSAGVSELILLGVWINALTIPYHARLMATGHPKTVVTIYLIQIPIYLFMLWIGLRNWGIAGAAGAWTLRVSIDTMMLLSANHALANTLRHAAPYAALIAIASASVFFLNLAPWSQWSLGLLLLGITLAKDLDLLVTTIKALTYQKAPIK